MAQVRTLILMRHATAGHQGATRDHDRPLTAQGNREAAEAGRWIRASLPAVDAVLCSSATRTRQTLLATAIRAPVSYQDALYGGGIDDIVELLGRVPSAVETVLVIGHAPGIPAVAAELARTAAEAGENRGGAADGGAADGDPAGTDGEGDGGNEPMDAEPGFEPDLTALRRFPAAAIAVLRTAAEWPEIGSLGGDLATVRLPTG